MNYINKYRLESSNKSIQEKLQILYRIFLFKPEQTKEGENFQIDKVSVEELIWAYKEKERLRRILNNEK